MSDFLWGAWDRWASLWPHLLTVLDILIALAASGHTILCKRDARAAVAWVGLIWLVPILGTLLYLLLGVNRIRRRARSLRAGHAHPEPPPDPCAMAVAEMPALRRPDAAHLAALARIVAGATGRTLLGRNRITPLRNGDEAYPAMIAAIDAARESVLLSIYIFDNDRAGALWKEEYNTERPHSSLGYQTPAEFSATCMRYVPIDEDLPDPLSTESTNR